MCIHDLLTTDVIIDGKTYTVEMSDEPISMKFLPINHALNHYDGIIFCFSVKSQPQFNSMKYVIQSKFNEQNKNIIPIIITGSWCTAESKRQVSTEEAKAFAMSFGFEYFEHDAKVNINCREIINSLVRQMIANETQENDQSIGVNQRCVLF